MCSAGEFPSILCPPNTAIYPASTSSRNGDRWGSGHAVPTPLLPVAPAQPAGHYHLSGWHALRNKELLGLSGMQSNAAASRSPAQSIRHRNVSGRGVPIPYWGGTSSLMGDCWGFQARTSIAARSPNSRPDSERCLPGCACTLGRCHSLPGGNSYGSGRTLLHSTTARGPSKLAGH
ncbi:hypothetical protein EJ06DRAFT_260410 [Trichodelitschia bisporula]|uniref:Uncharacterized protein n=1 Tax=Trichodelitschia bisporula TaxID=703511 RepID=A0A6G1HI21_9PEZI|nr:hypothetical protein EJ06DRAFT_260410 [Trichodelitschia bisporula]